MKTLIDQFIQYLKIDKGASVHTLTSYRRDLIQFEALNQTPLLERSEKDIESFLSSLRKKGQEASSRARKISALRQFYKFLIREEHLSEDPTLFIETPAKKGVLPKALTSDSMIRLLKGADQGLPYRGSHAQALKDRDRCMIYLLYATGLRVSELIALEVRRVDTEAGLLIVMGKRGKERAVPFPSMVSRLLVDYKNQVRESFVPKSENLFLGKNGHPLTRQAFWKTLKKIAIIAGIPTNLHPHMLRHTFATDLLKSGMNLRILQGLLGHADLQTTQVYTHVMPDKLK
ncbi:MAG: tyrosine recombinase, partial [Bdellovibrionales bacterium]|nr:tyrosine recombinase [Bdellovibrionales bacterium]